MKKHLLIIQKNRYLFVNKYYEGKPIAITSTCLLFRLQAGFQQVIHI